MSGRRTLVTYLIVYFFAIGTALRYLSLSGTRPEQVPPDIRWTLTLSFAFFFFLLVSEPWLSRRSPRYAQMKRCQRNNHTTASCLLATGCQRIPIRSTMKNSHA